jgi:hypothetical protein
MIEQRQLLGSIWDRGTLHAQLNRPKPLKERPARRSKSSLKVNNESSSESKPLPKTTAESSNGNTNAYSKSQHTFSMSDEMDMAISDEEVDNVASAFLEEEELSKYRRGAGNAKGKAKAIPRTPAVPEVVYVSDEEGSDGESVELGKPLSSTVEARREKVEGLSRRNRDYWAGKGSTRSGE